MADVVCELGYDLTKIPSQLAFHNSQARVRGYGGAMGGGKSRALCETVFDWMLQHPGIVVLIARQKHTSIVNTTRKTFLEQVLPSEIRGRKDMVRIKLSAGDDFVELWNGSIVHFGGLDDPGRWDSAELGALCFDEAHEVAEDIVLKINSRLRQRCRDCLRTGAMDCEHMPHKVVLTFNPSFPGHWLQQWFILGAERTEYGWRKEQLIGTKADFPIGDAEFFVARAADNPFLPPKYIENSLSGFSTMQRRRYLDGLWEHVSGEGFFDQDALSDITQEAMEEQPLAICEPKGNLTGTDDDNKPRLQEQRNGRMEVYKAPVRTHVTEEGEEVLAHRYVVSVDVSTGASADYSAIQVIDVDAFEQVAEWQGKSDPDKIAEAAFLTACVYNGAMLAPEVNTFGFGVVKAIQHMIAKYHGPPTTKPKMYTRPVVDRLSQKFTTVMGWNTNMQSRAHMLTILEQALRERSLVIHGQRTLAECAAFAVQRRNGTDNEYASPRAQSGAHDDLVIALAIGAAVATALPKKLMRAPRHEYEAMTSSVTGY